MSGRERILVVPLIAALSQCTVALAENIEAQGDAAQPSIVELLVTGQDYSNKAVSPAVGSGFIVHSDTVLGRTFILTAAHVVQKPEDWLRDTNDKVIGRKIRVRQQSSAGAMVVLDENATVISQNDERDVAVLAVSKSDIRSLPVSTSSHLRTTFQLVVTGFPATDLKFFPRILRIKSIDFSNLWIELDGIAEEAQSGGAVIDSNGYVVAIVSHNDNKQNPRFHTAAIVTFPLEMLNDYLHQRARPLVVLDDAARRSNKFAIESCSGAVSINVKGGSGEPANAEDEAHIGGGEVKALIEGKERSTCGDGWATTVSQAKAFASIEEFETTGLKSGINLATQGGYYSTPVTCLAGKPVGLIGHDTFASSRADISGEIDFLASSVPFDIRVVWQGMPNETQLDLIKPGDQHWEQIPAPESGEISVNIDTVGHWRLVLRSKVLISAEGAGSRSEFQRQPLIFLVPH